MNVLHDILGIGEEGGKDEFQEELEKGEPTEGE